MESWMVLVGVNFHISHSKGLLLNHEWMVGLVLLCLLTKTMQWGKVSATGVCWLRLDIMPWSLQLTACLNFAIETFWNGDMHMWLELFHEGWKHNILSVPKHKNYYCWRGGGLPILMSTVYHFISFQGLSDNSKLHENMKNSCLVCNPIMWCVVVSASVMSMMSIHQSFQSFLLSSAGILSFFDTATFIMIETVISHNRCQANIQT